ncbi:MAG: DUF3955 domain-containing protein [Maledivibacter sp.]|jgi:uncharacterized membrane protein YdcZ (DUF606 family)|nr:DUF3955 domain-containing protein [Maledivibacter sp.]
MKKYLLTLISFIVGFCCLTTYNIIGAKVAPDGTLLEPFYLIPLSYIFIFLGIIFGIFSLFRNPKRIR